MNIETYYDSLPFGGRAALARQLGIANTYLWQICRGRKPIPPKLCIPIEAATDGAVTRYEARPDVFGAPPVAAESKAA